MSGKCATVFVARTINDGAQSLSMWMTDATPVCSHHDILPASSVFSPRSLVVGCPTDDFSLISTTLLANARHHYFLRRSQM